jgi:hypothetical protein
LCRPLQILKRDSPIGPKNYEQWESILKRVLVVFEEIEQELLLNSYSRGFTPKVMDRDHHRTLSPDGHLIFWCIEAFSMYLRAVISNMNGFRLVGSRELPYDYFVGCAGQFNWKLTEKGTENLKGALYCASKSAILVHQHPNTPCRAYTRFRRFDSNDEVKAAAAYSKTLANMCTFVSLDKSFTQSIELFEYN